jgi:hypothetical protein
MNQPRFVLATVSMAAALVVAGCTVPPAPAAAPTTGASSTSTPATANGPLAKLATFTHDDFRTAIKIAQAQQPPDTEAVSCFTFLDGLLTNLDTIRATAIPPDGIVSTFEAGHVSVAFIQNGLSADQRVKLEQACGPYLLNVVGGLNFLLDQIKVPPIPLPKL